MIRWITRDEWKNFIQNSLGVGKYISHSLVNNEINNSPDKYHFSNAVVKVQVRQENSNKSTDIYFNNNGVVKIKGDTHSEFNESAEYTVYYSHPHMIDITCLFISMMVKKFGVRYLVPRATHCKEEIEECTTDIPFHTSDADRCSNLIGKINTNTSNLINFSKLDKKTLNLLNNKDKIANFEKASKLRTIYPELNIPLNKELPRTKMDKLIDSCLSNIMKEEIEELEYLKDYIDLQNSFLDYLTYEYTAMHSNTIAPLLNYEKQT